MAEETLNEETVEENLTDHALETEEPVAETFEVTEPLEEEDVEAAAEEAPAEDLVEDEVEVAEEEYAAQVNEADEITTEMYTSLQTELEEVKTKFADLEAEAEGLRAFKHNIEDKQKDELIKSFYMLSDEDKEDVITNKSEYSLEEIEAKLAVIAVRKKVSFDQEEEKDEAEPAVIFNLESAAETVPAFVQVLRKTKKDD